MRFDTKDAGDPTPQNPLDEGAEATDNNDADGSWAEAFARLDEAEARYDGSNLVETKADLAPSTYDADAPIPTESTPGTGDPAPAPGGMSGQTGSGSQTPQESGSHPGPFPLDSLPEWLRDIVAGTARFTQTPVDLPGAVALGVIAACCGGRVKVEVRGGWVEPTNLFIVTAMPPGSRKSAVFTRLTQPLLQVESELTEKLRPEINAAQTRRDVLTRAADLAKKAAAKNPDDEQLMKVAIAAEIAATSVAVPATPRLFVDDATQESVASHLAEQRGRIAVLSAEGGIFSILAGRYSGSGAPNLEIFLKGHAGDAVRVDRKGRPPEHIDEPALTMCLTVQPEVLRDMGQSRGFEGRGFPARILYVMPANNIGSRTVSPHRVPPAIHAAYDERVIKLHRVLNDLPEPVVLALSPDAEALILDFEKHLEPRLAVEGDLADVTAWAAKLTGAVARIAGLLHVAGDDPAKAIRTAVSAEEMRSAIALGEYFIDQAETAFAVMGGDGSISSARVVADYLHRHGITSITSQKLFSALSRSRFPRMTDLQRALDVLEENGVIQKQEQPPSGKAGRPATPTYVVVGAETEA